MELVEFDRHINEFAVLPCIGFMRMIGHGWKYKYRIVLWWLLWQVSIGVWKQR